MIEANIRADAEPATKAIRTTVIISCPAPFERLEVFKTPTIGDRTIRKPYEKSTVSSPPAWYYGHCGAPRRGAPGSYSSADHVGKQTEIAGALDGARELSLLPRGDGGDAA